MGSITKKLSLIWRKMETINMCTLTIFEANSLRELLFLPLPGQIR